MLTSGVDFVEGKLVALWLSCWSEEALLGLKRWQLPSWGIAAEAVAQLPPGVGGGQGGWMLRARALHITCLSSRVPDLHAAEAGSISSQA